MQFKYPELLYFLFLLLIPILIHLFQLRKFEKVPFTNVKFLKKIELQTRKSSKLKKFLVLLTRLFFIASLVFAFAQPFYSNYKQGQKSQTIVYLDNSLSMQAKKNTTSLLEEAKQELLKQINEKNANISLLTNNNFYTNLSKKDLKNTILSIDYYPITVSFSKVLQKAKYLYSRDKNTKKNIVLLSDFQNFDVKKIDSSLHYKFVKLQPNNVQNYAVDSLYVSKNTADEITLKAITSSATKTKNNSSFSLFDDNRLLGKSAVNYSDKTEKEITFTISNTQNINGKITTNDTFLQFDNTLYFTTDKPDKINVLAIGKDTKYLAKIYTKDQFNFSSVSTNQIDFNAIKMQHTIILNEMDAISLLLQKVVVEFVSNGGTLVIIPSEKIDLKNYNLFFTSLHFGNLAKQVDNELLINKINFSHPVLKGVFEKKVQNFQYPKVSLSYTGNTNNKSTILLFENKNPFISQKKINKGKLFWFASPINNKVSNFKNSPLIVPVFYNIASQSFEISKLYYLIGKNNALDIPIKMQKDEVLKLREKNKPENTFIPLQKVYNDKVRLEFNDFPVKDGFYQVIKNDKVIKEIAFNYSRVENKLTYTDLAYLKKYKNVTITDDIAATFNTLTNENNTINYWKTFLIIALAFLFLEMLILKFWKN